MKYALAILVLALAMCCVPAAGATASATPPPVPVKSLILGAEFNGPAGVQPSHRLWGAKSFGKWSGWSHIKQNGAGILTLTAYKNTLGWHMPWLSGKIGYTGPRYVEARANVPCSAGAWSAPIWEWAQPYGRAPDFENDVSEQLGQEPTSYHATLHYWPSSGGNHESGRVVTATSPLCGTFHTYGAAVFSNHVDFYLDGTLDDFHPRLGDRPLQPHTVERSHEHRPRDGRLGRHDNAQQPRRPRRGLHPRLPDVRHHVTNPGHAVIIKHSPAICRYQTRAGRNRRHRGLMLPRPPSSRPKGHVPPNWSAQTGGHMTPDGLGAGRVVIRETKRCPLGKSGVARRFERSDSPRAEWAPTYPHHRAQQTL